MNTERHGTKETYVSHPYRYGSIIIREGARGTSFQVKLRKFGTDRWRTTTRHSYHAACKVLATWNAEYEAAYAHKRRMHDGE